jgi:hypothetical protein
MASHPMKVRPPCQVTADHGDRFTDALDILLTGF